MKLKQARVIFSSLIILLPNKAKELGYSLAFDELTNHQGKGHKLGSLHYSGCAGDVLLYDADDNYVTDSRGYSELGAYWKTLHPLCRWGGDFKSKDYNHFSFSPPELFGNSA